MQQVQKGQIAVVIESRSGRWRTRAIQILGQYHAARKHRQVQQLRSQSKSPLIIDLLAGDQGRETVEPAKEGTIVPAEG